MSLLENLPHTAQLWQKIRVADEYGQGLDTFVKRGARVKCWRQGVSDNEINQFEKRGIKVSCKFYFTKDPGIDATYFVECDGLFYTVQSTSNPDASVGLGYLWRIMAMISTTVGDSIQKAGADTIVNPAEELS